MAIKYYSSIDLRTNQLQNALLHNSGTDPTDPTPADGQIYFNTGDNTIRVRYGSAWNVLSVGAGDITSVTITTDSGGGSAASDTSGDAAFSLLGTSGVGVTNSGATITVTSVPGEIDHDSLLNFASGEHFTQGSITATGAINSGSITSGFGNIDNGSSTLDTGAITGTTIDASTDFTIDGLVLTADTITNDAALTVVSTGLTFNASLDIALSADGGNVTMDDGTTTVFDFNTDDPELKIMDDAQVANWCSIAVGANGATTISTVDNDAAAANLIVTADGTVDIDSAGVLTLDSGAAINIEPASGSAILLDGTISVDAGVVTGATSITSTAFVGALTGNASGTAATVTTAAQTNITSLGTLTALTVDDIQINGATIGHGDDTDLMTLADGILTVAGEVSMTTLDLGGQNVTASAGEINVLDAVSAGTVTAALAVVVDGSKDIGTFRNITLSGELDAGSLDVSGDADIDGTLEADAITINSTAIGSIYGAIAGSSSIVTTGALDSGSITSGFGTIDTGSSAITTTGAISGGTGSTFSSSSASQPVVHITNTHAGATAGELRFNKDTASGDDNDVMGTISWYGTDAGEATHEKLAYIDAIITDSAAGSEASSLRFYVAENDANLTAGLTIAGQADADGEVDVTIGAGAASTTTIIGNLIVSGNTTTVNTATLSVEDPLILMANGQTGTASVDMGLIGERGDDANAGFIWDESSNTWSAITTSDTGTTAGNVTIADYADIRGGTITADDGFAGDVTGDLTGTAADATVLETARTINGVSFNGSANITVTAAGSTLSDTVTVAKGGTGQTSLTDGYALLGNGSSALEMVNSTADSSMLVGNGSTMVSESGATLRTSIGCNPVTGGTGIITVGTVGEGTWEATDVAVAHGGTGASSLSSGAVLVGNGTGAVAHSTNLSFGGSDLGIASTGQIQFRDSNSYIYSPTANDLEIVATDITLDAATLIDLQSDAVYIGEGGDADVVLTFNANTSDGVITWMEDEDHFLIGDDMVIAEKLYIDDEGGEYISGDGSTATMTGAWAAANMAISGGSVTGITDLVVADGGTGVSTLTDGGVLLGSGTGAITALAVLADSEMIVGDGTGDPVAESGATLRTSIGCNPVTGSSSITTLGTIATGTWEATDVAISHGGTGASTASAAFTALKQDATTSATGVAELATSAETLTGTDTARVVTPDGLAARTAVATIDVSAMTTAGNHYAEITHSLGTEDVIVQLFDATTKDTVHADILRTDKSGSASTSKIKVLFAKDPTVDVEVVITSFQGASAGSVAYA